MFFLSPPSFAFVERHRLALADAPLSYVHVECTRGAAPRGFHCDHNRVVLGTGAAVFERAQQALVSWRMFDLSFVRLHAGQSPPQVGTVAAVLASHLGFHSLNFCRVVYLIDEDGPVRRYGFAYGTLAEHAERGEERFLIEWNRDDDSVSYDLLAYSRPAHPMAWMGYPLARHFQRRFARESLAAMVAATRT